MKNIYQNEDVKHSSGCCSVDCLLDGKVRHVRVCAFETKDATYHAETFTEAGNMWVNGGQQELLSIDSLG